MQALRALAQVEQLRGNTLNLILQRKDQKRLRHRGHGDRGGVRVDTDDHSFITDGFVSHNTEARLNAYAQDPRTVVVGIPPVTGEQLFGGSERQFGAFANELSRAEQEELQRHSRTGRELAPTPLRRFG